MAQNVITLDLKVIRVVFYFLILLFMVQLEACVGQVRVCCPLQEEDGTAVA